MIVFSIPGVVAVEFLIFLCELTTYVDSLGKIKTLNTGMFVYCL